MDNYSQYMDELLARYFAGEASGEETAEVLRWKNMNDANRESFELAAVIFSAGKKSGGKPLDVDTQAAWRKVSSKLHSADETAPSNVISFKPKQNMWWRIAAVFIVLFGITFSLYDIVINTGEEITMQSFARSVTDTLPDGSVFTLNKESSLSYESGSFRKKRNLKLQGEAFFDVVHNDAVKFVVEANGLIIQDLGTSFNIKAREHDNYVLVSVVTGEVKIYTSVSKAIILKAGDEARYTTTDNMIEVKHKITPNITAYKDKFIIFDNTSLPHVVELLSQVYDKEIVLENANLNTCVINATFNNEKLDDIVSIITETLNLKSKTENNTIVIYGDGCK